MTPEDGTHHLAVLLPSLQACVDTSVDDHFCIFLLATLKLKTQTHSKHQHRQARAWQQIPKERARADALMKPKFSTADESKGLTTTSTTYFHQLSSLQRESFLTCSPKVHKSAEGTHGVFFETPTSSQSKPQWGQSTKCESSQTK